MYGYNMSRIERAERTNEWTKQRHKRVSSNVERIATRIAILVCKYVLNVYLIFGMQLIHLCIFVYIIYIQSFIVSCMLVHTIWLFCCCCCWFPSFPLRQSNIFSVYYLVVRVSKIQFRFFSSSLVMC